jgi:tRNA threonylcarbamoyladenosine biosynthesis protein TsaB
MATILCIETATPVCSVAVSVDGEQHSLVTERGANLHASKLTIIIQQVLDEAGLTLKKLDGVAVSKGPGSYTGLRVGVSTAKGLCYALNIPLVAVGTLRSRGYL